MSLADAVLALLRADPNLTVYDGIVPESPAYPFVVAYFDAGTRSPYTLAGQSSSSVHRFQCSVNADNAVSARIVAGKVLGRLLDVRPTVTGWTCWPIRHESSPPAYTDDSLATPVVIQPLIFTMRAVIT